MLRSRKTYLFGVPLLVIVAIAAVFVWGQLQPRPQGYAPSAIARSTPPTTTVAAQPAIAATVAPTPAVSTEPVRYTVDATNQDAWVFFDFTAGTVVDSTVESLDWDFAFRRTALLTNGGETNRGGPTGVFNLGEGELEAAEVPASVEFAVDELGGEDNDKLSNPQIPKWYFYNFIRHVVVARENVYLVRTGESHDALVRFDSYYCDDDAPGCVTFEYRLVPRVDQP